MKEILTGIFTWPWFSEPHGYNFNGHFIRHAGGNLCIDPVEPTENDFAELAGYGVARILLTNRNHSRAANKVRAHTGARTAIHPADASHARSEGARAEMMSFRSVKRSARCPSSEPMANLQVKWCYIRRRRKILIVGDAVVGDPPGRCKLLPEKVVDDLPRLRESVRSLLSLDFDILLPGDGEPILQSAKERLRDLVNTFPR